MSKSILEAKKQLRQTDLLIANCDSSYKDIIKSYDIAIKKCPKNKEGAFLTSIINAKKAKYLFIESIVNENEKLSSKLLDMASKFAEIASQDEENLLGLYVSAKIKLKKGDISEEEAKEISQKVINSNARCWEDYYAQFSAICYVSKLELGIIKLQEALQMPNFKDDFRIYTEIGYALRDISKYEEAKEAFRNALKYEPSFYYMNFQIAKTLATEGGCDDLSIRKAKYQEAKKELLLCREGRQKSGLKDDKELLSYICLMNGELDLIEEDIIESTKAVKMFPEEIWSHVSLGIALSKKDYKSEKEKKSAFKKAKSEFEKALKLDPDDILTWASKAYMYANFGEIKDAIDALKEAKLLVNTESGQSYLSNTSSVSEFVEFMTNDRYDQLVTQLETMEAEREEFAISGSVDYSKEQVEVINVTYKRAEKQAVQAISKDKLDSIDFAFEGRDEYKARVKDIDVKFMELKSIPQVNEFVHSFAHTITVAYDTALALAGGHGSFQTKSGIAGLFAFAALAPFGGPVIAQIAKKAADVAETRHQESKFAGLNKHFSTTQECSFFAQLAAIKVCEELQGKILSIDNSPTEESKGLLSKIASWGKKLVKGEDPIHATPVELYGYKLGGELMAEMMLKNGEIMPNPIFTRDLRAADFIIDQEGVVKQDSSSGPLSSLSKAFGSMFDAFTEFGEFM